MSVLREIAQKVKELMDELEKLQPEEKTEEFEYPFKENEPYEVIIEDGRIVTSCWTNHNKDCERYEQGNVFKTRDEAIRERDKRALLTRFRQFRDKCNEEWKQKREDCIDFNGYHIEIYNGTDDGMLLRSDWDPVCERFCLFGYFKKQVDCDRAIELFGDEIKRLYLEW